MKQTYVVEWAAINIVRRNNDMDAVVKVVTVFSHKTKHWLYCMFRSDPPGVKGWVEVIRDSDSH